MSGVETFLEPGRAALWGLARVLVSEFPEIALRRVDLDPDGARRDVTARLVDELSCHTPEDEVAWRGAERYVARTRESRSSEADSYLDLSGDGAYIVTAESAALGARAVWWLSQRGAARIFLLMPPECGDGAAIHQEIEACAVTDVAIRGADIADAEALGEIVQEADAPGSPLRGVLHMPASLPEVSLFEEDLSLWRRRVSEELTKAWNLHRATAQHRLEFFILVSSATTLLGSPGRSGEASVGAFQQGLVALRRARGLPGVALHSGPWTQWDDGSIGVLGLEPLDPVDVLGAFEGSLGRGSGDQAILQLDSRQWLSLNPIAGEWPRLAEILRPPSWSAGGETPLVRELSVLGEDERRARLVELLRRELGRVLGASLGEAATEIPFQELGLDSRMGVELRNRLESSLGILLPVRLVFAHPTVVSVAKALSRRLHAHAIATATREQAKRSAAPEAERRMAELEALDDATVERLLIDTVERFDAKTNRLEG